MVVPDVQEAHDFYAELGFGLSETIESPDHLYAAWMFRKPTVHDVAFTEGLSYDVRRFGGTKGLFFSGEGFICEFNGQGRLYMQTRNVGAFAAFLQPFLPTPSN